MNRKLSSTLLILLLIFLFASSCSDDSKSSKDDDIFNVENQDNDISKNEKNDTSQNDISQKDDSDAYTGDESNTPADDDSSEKPDSSEMNDSGSAEEPDTDKPADSDNPVNPGCNEIPTFADRLSPTTEIHVSKEGNDASGDGSSQKPYATISHAASKAGPGTAILIHEGSYNGGNYISNLRGTPSAPIWFGGASGEDKPVVEGSGEGIHLSNVSYLIVHDLEVRGSASNGINCDDGGETDNPEATHHVIFKNLYIHDIGNGGNQDCLKLSGVNDYFVLDSEMHTCGGGGSGSAIDHVGCHHGLIARNHLHDLSANAIQCKGGTEDLEIRWNRLINAGARAVNMGGSTSFQYFRPPLSTSKPNAEARNVRVVSNIIEGGEASLAFVGCVECAAVNNTIINPTNWILRILQETTSKQGYEFEPCRDNLVMNNLIYFDRSDLSTYVNIGPNVSEKTFTFTSNLWYAHDNPSSSTPNIPVTETNPIIAKDPGFTDGWKIGESSPAFAAGTYWEGLLGDIGGNCYKNPPSIGSHEPGKE